MKGKASITSQARMMTASTLPPKKPETRPSVVPMMSETTTDISPTISEIWQP